MDTLSWLNYHHLLYFRTIVVEGGVTKAAQQLNLSQSTLSAQLRTLEESLGTPLFERSGRRLELTEAGQMALNYAEEIHRNGRELQRWFSGNPVHHNTIRLGAISPLSKTLQFELIRPFIMEGSTRIHVTEGEFPDLCEKLHKYQIDILISNQCPGGVQAEGTQSFLLGEMAVYLVGLPPFKIPKKPFPDWLEGIPLFLPSSHTMARVGFDDLLSRADIHPEIRAEVDDMALLRLLALSGAGLALVPEIGVKFELQEKRLLKIEKIQGINERFYATILKRKRIPPIFLEVIEKGTEALKVKSEKPRRKKKSSN